jgi:NADPH2:quinone reductase
VKELMDWYVAGKLKPEIYAKYPMKDVAKALDDIASRRVTGKVVLLPKEA